MILPPPQPGQRFNPPPGWPPAEPNWMPPAGWEPPADWPAAPEGWQWYTPPAKRKGWMARHKALTMAAAVVLLIIVVVVAASSGSGGSTHAKTNNAASPAAAPASASPAAPPVPALTAPQQAFVGHMKDTYGFSGDDDTTIAGLGTSVCDARSAGNSQQQAAALVKGELTAGSGNSLPIVRLAEVDLCKQYYVAATVVFAVSGSGAPDITYGSDSDNRQGASRLPFATSLPLNEQASYYVVTAQLQGSGDITCTLTIDGKLAATGHASGSYNICSAQAGKDPSTGDWTQE